MGRPKGSKSKVSRGSIERLFPLWEATIEAALRNKKINIRLEAARIAAPYLAQKMPERIDNRNAGKITIGIEYAKAKEG